MARPFAMAADAPADRLQTMRAAFNVTMRDATFADAKKSNRDVNPLAGQKLGAFVKELYATPGNITQEAARAMDGGC